jgi:hypothetical protein
MSTWRERRWHSVVLPALAVAGFVLVEPATSLGAWYRDRSFLGRLPAYERVVDGLRSHSIPLGRVSPEALTPELRGCCYRVNAVRDSTGQLLVEFWEEFGFPPAHSGWAYYSGDSGKAGLRAHGWSSGYVIRPHWYRVSD